MILRTSHYLLISLAAVLMLGGLGFFLFYDSQPKMRVLCGSSMKVPIDEITPLFETGDRRMEVDFGGSETLLPRVVVDKVAADIFVCHDPFEEKVRAAGQLSDSVAVGVLRPVLLVQKGNPLKLAAVADLARPGLKFGNGDPRYSTCGQMFVDLLKRKNLYEKVQPNIALESRSHSELADGLITGHLDAAIVWNFAARLHQAKTDVVPTDDEYPPVRVTIVGLKHSPRPELRDAFLDFCRTEQAKAIFVKHGYGEKD